jgi:hypothetical protein
MGQRVTKVSLDSPVFVSLGMVVLDELRFPHQHPVFGVPGGSGLYGTSDFFSLIPKLRQSSTVFYILKS